VADTGAHRVLEVDPQAGTILRVFGSGQPGFRDGSAAEARFRDPQGMVLFQGDLLVADTGNHALRRIALSSGEVTTVAGTGALPRTWPPQGGPARSTPLDSPWDLATDGRQVFLAMAGCHQLWRWDPATGRVEPLAGSGREGIHDGPGPRAALAQPSGLALEDSRLWFADAEASAVRVLHLEAGTVETFVGQGLFVFGDRDGGGEAVRLQHPLGVAVWEGKVLVADTFNNKIRLLDPRTRECRTFLGTGEEVLREDALTFWEPGGLAVEGDTLFVADTNHHRVVAVDLPTGRWRVLLGGAVSR
jgi:sugar lactone lactonase YvrE